MELSRLASRRGSLLPDTWEGIFRERARQWEIPLVNLSDLGLTFDRDGLPSNSTLKGLKPGAEAEPYLDQEQNVVYKLFFANKDGSVGKKLHFRFGEDGFDVTDVDAHWLDTVEKIKVLNAGGGLPTELVGFDSAGKYLIAKQPRAYRYLDFFKDLEAAEQAMCGVHPIGGELRGRTIISWVDGRPWAISDLHKGNIMRDSSELPVIIDALLGKSPLRRKSAFHGLRRRASRHAHIESKASRQEIHSEISTMPTFDRFGLKSLPAL